MNLNKHSKVRAAGLSCFLAMALLLGLAVFCPFSGGEETHAADITQAGNISIDFILQKVVPGNISIDFLLAPTLSVSVDSLPANVAEEVTPSKDGQTFSKITSFKVSSNSTDGYGIYVTGTSSDLTSDTTSTPITGTATTKDSLSALEINTWGYNLTKGTSVTPANLSYKKLATTKGTADATGNVVTNQEYRLTFGGKVGYATTAGTYTNTVKVNIVASGASTVATAAYNPLLEDILIQLDEEKEYQQKLAREKQVTEGTAEEPVAIELGEVAAY